MKVRLIAVLPSVVASAVGCAGARPASQAEARTEVRPLLAVLEHVQNVGTYHVASDTFEIRIAQILVLQERYGAPLSLLQELGSSGFELAEYPPSTLNLREGEIRVSFDVPTRVARDSFRVYAELAYVWACPIGDIEAFTFLVTCERRRCRVVGRDVGVQAEIGVDRETCSSAADG